MPRFPIALPLSVVLASSFWLCSHTRAQQITRSPTGIQTLKVGGTSFNWIRPARQGSGSFGDVTLQGTLTLPNGTSYDVGKPKIVQTEGGHNTNYTWGTVQTRVSIEKGRLTWKVRVENTSPDELSIKEVRFLEFLLPGNFESFKNNATSDGIDSPGFVWGSWPQTTLADGTTQPAGRLAFVLTQGEGQISVGPRSNNAYPLKFIPSSSIAPGEVRVYSTSLRFGEEKAKPIALAPDIFEKASASHPFTVTWRDRRPLGRWFLASAGKHPPTNRRGWFNNDPSIDITTESGRAAFAQKLLATAQQIANRNTAMDGQGVVLWDIEGQQFGHPISYLGLPLIRDLSGKTMGVTLPPEMEEEVFYNGRRKPLVDHLFDVLRMSGKLGICIRPTIALTSAYARVTAPTQPIYPSHYYEADWAQTLIDKISYAKQRWGCSIFYIDSNRPDASQLRKVALAHPDVLLIPEWSSPFSQGVSASYRSADNLGQIEPLFLGRQLYPQSFGVLAVNNKNLTADRDRVLAEVKKGSILFYTAWFDDKNTNDPIKSIYAQAR